MREDGGDVGSSGKGLEFGIIARLEVVGFFESLDVCMRGRRSSDGLGVWV